VKATGSCGRDHQARDDLDAMGHPRLSGPVLADQAHAVRTVTSHATCRGPNCAVSRRESRTISARADNPSRSGRFTPVSLEVLPGQEHPHNVYRAGLFRISRLPRRKSLRRDTPAELLSRRGRGLLRGKAGRFNRETFSERLSPREGGIYSFLGKPDDQPSNREKGNKGRSRRGRRPKAEGRSIGEASGAYNFSVVSFREKARMIGG